MFSLNTVICFPDGGHESVLRLLHKISGGKRLLVLLTDRRGNTALHLAALKGHIDCADLLLKIGADPEVRNKVNVYKLKKRNNIYV